MMPEPTSEKIGDRVSIYKRGANWHANFQLDGRQKRQSLKTSSKKEAVRRAVRLDAELQTGNYRAKTKVISIEALTQKYIAHLRTERRAPRTLAKIDLVMRRVLDLAARRHATSITEIDLDFIGRYRAERVEAKAMPKTVLNESVIVKQLMNFAVDRGIMVASPLKSLRLKKVKTRTQPCWTRAEVVAILAASKKPHLPALTVLAETGMRVGEAQHLTWDDVDFRNNVIHIRAKDDWQPKTGDQRVINMSDLLIETLTHLPRNTRWVLTAAASRKFPAGDHQISARRLLEYLKRVLKRLGLRGHLHTFRHAFISHALTSGTPEAIVRKWVGHVDAGTIRHYTHVADQISQDAMKKLTASAIAEQPARNGEAEAVDGLAQN